MKTLNDSQKKQARLILADKLGFDIEDILEISDLKNHLGVTSLDLIELTTDFEDAFNCNIPDDFGDTITTVSDLYDSLALVIVGYNFEK